MGECYIINELPVDVAVERGVCKYEVQHHWIEKETNTLVWTKRLWPGIDRDKVQSYRMDRSKFDRFGRFASKEEAQEEIYSILLDEVVFAENRLRQAEEQLKLFRGLPTTI